MVEFKGDTKAIFLVFVGAIITATLIAAIATQTNLLTNTFSVSNVTVTGSAVNVSLDLTGRELVGTPVVGNVSNITGNDLQDRGVIVSTSTSTTTGLRSVVMTINDTGSDYAAQNINVTYTYRPDGYVSTGGGRSITSLIPLFAALAILIFVVVVFIKFGSLGTLIRRS